MRQLGADLMGLHGAPYPDDTPTARTPVANLAKDFKINPVQDKLDFYIERGCYYVNGIRCENKEKEDGRKLTFRNQHNGLFADEVLDNGKQYLVCLDVWERHITYVEDDYIREKALGGADTASRAQIVWQVKTKEVVIDENLSKTLVEAKSYETFITTLGEEKRFSGTGKLKVQTKTTEV